MFTTACFYQKQNYRKLNSIKIIISYVECLFRDFQFFLNKLFGTYD